MKDMTVKIVLHLTKKTLKEMAIVGKMINEGSSEQVIASAIDIAKPIIACVSEGGAVIIQDKCGKQQEMKIEVL